MGPPSPLFNRHTPPHTVFILCVTSPFLSPNPEVPMRALRLTIPALCVPFFLATPASAGPKKLPLPKPRPTALVLDDQIKVLKTCVDHYRELETDLKRQADLSRRDAVFRFFTIGLRLREVYGIQHLRAVPEQARPLLTEKEVLMEEVRTLRRQLYWKLNLRPPIASV